MNLHEIFEYNELTGNLIWLIGNTKGSIAGTKRKDSYIGIQLNGKKYLAHRLIFLLKTGHIPEQIDHINRIRFDNRWENLRPATNSLNQVNRSLQKNNTSGYRGVTWNKHHKKWKTEVRYTIDGKKYRRHLGYFDDPKKAYEIYKKTMIDLYGIEWVESAYS